MGCHGPFRSELSSSIKYGFLERLTPGKVQVSQLARSIIRPTSSSDELSGLRTALLNAPQLSDFYKHYRGENLPDEPFLSNAFTDIFHIPTEKSPEFKTVLMESLQDAMLIEKRGDKYRILDVSEGEGVTIESDSTGGKVEKGTHLAAGETCFVMMPFSEPLGSYYKKIYEPAIVRTGLRPVRADDRAIACRSWVLVQ